jgi:hypothetical protein
MNPDQLTKNPICPSCREEMLTDQEIARARNSPGLDAQCWFCLARALVNMGHENGIPDPAEFGRANIDKTAAIGMMQFQGQRGAPTTLGDAVHKALSTPPAAMDRMPQQGTQAFGNKPVINMPAPIADVRLSEEERKDFIKKHGVDPTPRGALYEIVVHGAMEDLAMKLTLPVAIDAAEEREIRRIMQGFIDIIGKLLKFGAQFAATLIELQNSSSDMFLGRR